MNFSNRRACEEQAQVLPVRAAQYGCTAGGFSRVGSLARPKTRPSKSWCAAWAALNSTE